MTIDEAKRAGAAAFGAGRPCAPALNTEFIKQACAAASDLGTPLVDLLDAYGNGWTVAHLAKDAPIQDMPSVIQLQHLTKDSAP